MLLYYFRCFFVLLLFGFSLTIYGQESVSLSGVLTDVESGEQLPSASIKLIDSANDKVFVTTSNPYGFYNIVLPAGTYEVEISFLGYEPLIKLVSLMQSVSLDFELFKESQDLDEVIVKSYGQHIASTEISTHEVVVSEIKRLPVVLGEVDILKTLQLLPGVTNTGDASTGFNVRGGNQDQNLILLDEAPLFNPSHLFGLFSAFNANAIKTFKFYKGGIPAHYGGRASSVLDVRQFEGNNKKYQLDGGVGILSANLSIQGPIYKRKGQEKANNSFFIAGRRSYFDLFLGLSSDEQINTSSLYFYDLNIKTNWQVNKKNQLFLSAYLGQDFFGFGTLFVNGWGNITSTLRWNHIYNNNLFSNISVVYSNYGYSLTFNDTQNGFAWEGAINNLFLKGNWEYKMDNNNSFVTGFVSSYVQTDPGAITPKAPTSAFRGFSSPFQYGLENAIYIEWIKKINAQLSFNAGLRLNWFARLGSDELNLYANDQPVTYVSSTQKYIASKPTGTIKYQDGIYYNHLGLDPRLNVTYVLNDFLSLKASYNTLHQYMQLLTNNATITPIDIYRLAGKYIKPLVSNQVSLGVFATLPVNEQNLEISVELFYKWFQDGLDYIDGSNLLFNSSPETEIMSSDGRAYGIEFLFEKKWGRLSGWLSYTFSSSQFLPQAPSIGGRGINDGRVYSTPYDLPHNLSLIVNYDFSNRIHASLIFSYRSGKPASFATSKFEYKGLVLPFYGNRNEFRYEDYHHLDLSLTFEGRERKHFQSNYIISIYNIYNRQNAYSYVFPTVEAQSDASSVEKLSIYGIVPSVTWQFVIK